MPSLPPAKLRRVERHAMQMGPDERRAWLLVEFAGGEQATLGPYDRESLLGMVAMVTTREAGPDLAFYADPETDSLRVAWDGFTDGQVEGGV